MKTKCRNLTKDRNGDWSCKSTHVCYKPYCMEPDLFSPGLTVVGGKFVEVRQEDNGRTNQERS